MNRRAIWIALLACGAALAGSPPALAQTSGVYAGCYPGEYPGDPGEYPCVPCPDPTVGIYPTCIPPIVIGPGDDTPPPPPPPPPPGAQPPPPPPPPAAGSRIRNASLKLRSGRRFAVDALGRVNLGTMSCPLAATSCRSVRLRFEVPRHPAAKSLALTTVSVKPGQVKTLRVKLATAPRRTLRRKKTLTTRLVIRRATLKAVLRTLTLRRK